MLIADGLWTALRWIWTILGIAVVAGIVRFVFAKTTWRPGPVLGRPLVALLILAVVGWALLPEPLLKHTRTAWIVTNGTNGPTRREAMVFFGAARMRLHDGHTVELPGRDEGNELAPMPLIVNDYDQPLSIQQISYGYPGHDPEPVEVPPGAVVESPCGFDDLVHDVPSSVEAQYGVATRCWVVW